MVSNIFYVHPYLRKWSNLTNMFQMGWNHLVMFFLGGFDWFFPSFQATPLDPGRNQSSRRVGYWPPKKHGNVPEKTTAEHLKEIRGLDRGSLNATHFGYMKQCKLVVIYSDLPFNIALFGLAIYWPLLENLLPFFFGGGGELPLFRLGAIEFQKEDSIEPAV